MSAPHVVEHGGRIVGPFDDVRAAARWSLDGVRSGEREHIVDYIRPLRESDEPEEPWNHEVARP